MRCALLSRKAARRPPASGGQTTVEDGRFRALLPAAEWERLPVEVRRRFSKRLAGAESAIFVGEVTELRMSRLGYCLAQALRLVGAPLPTSLATGTPSVVSVTEDGATGGQVWSRLYGRRDGFPQVINSAKRFAGPTGLEEYIGCGLTMALAIRVEDGCLAFRSRGYFLGSGARRLRLPRWLACLDLVVRHRAVTHDSFTFTLDLTHPWFGELVHQSAVYHDEATP